jgi:hypothetical protein
MAVILPPSQEGLGVASVNSENERQAMLITARGIPGVKEVEDRMAYPPVHPPF